METPMEKLCNSEVFQLQQGLILRIEELETRVKELQDMKINNDEMLDVIKYWQKDLKEAIALKERFNTSYNVTFKKY
jgi:uncharacterized protein YigA (DUF484 family)